MGKRIDITGQRYGRLVVLERAEDHITESGKRITRWKCICDCGNKKIIRQSELRNGHTQSCGCLHKEIFGSLNRTHGLSSKCGRLYPLWKSIKYRCYSPNCRYYKDYGGRGIVMCDEWRDNFQNFYDWAMANGYKEEKTEKGVNKLSIDRIDVNGNYEPSNCRFATNEVQARNQRKSMKDSERYRTCPICGKIFEIKQRSSTKTTCSKKCNGLLKRLNNKKDYTKTCPVCNKEFNAKRGGHYKDAVYCSNECRNKSFSPIWEYNGEKLRVVEWAERTGVNAHCLLHRKDMGWDIERILTTPIKSKKRGVNIDNS